MRQRERDSQTETEDFDSDRRLQQRQTDRYRQIKNVWSEKCRNVYGGKKEKHLWF